MLRKSRGRSMVAVVVAGVLAATGGTAWAMWRLSGSGTSTTTAASTIDLKIVARPRPDTPLFPGARTDLMVTVENPNPFPVRVTLVHIGTGPITADAAHRDAGCVTTGISPTKGAKGVSWPVGAGSSERFLLRDALQMRDDSDSACQGATFSIPLTASGSSDA
ncbi:MAG TPA: hypothetical protein VN408_36315 [Actinoplanes sp.]|nr:hypothetical protein [Actinoplanes sp.]